MADTKYTPVVVGNEKVKMWADEIAQNLNLANAAQNLNVSMRCSDAVNAGELKLDDIPAVGMNGLEFYTHFICTKALDKMLSELGLISHNAHAEFEIGSPEDHYSIDDFAEKGMLEQDFPDDIPVDDLYCYSLGIVVPGVQIPEFFNDHVAYVIPISNTYGYSDKPRSNEVSYVVIIVEDNTAWISYPQGAGINYGD